MRTSVRRCTCDGAAEPLGLTYVRLSCKLISTINTASSDFDEHVPEKRDWCKENEVECDKVDII